jgi:hypothetical protein
MESQMIRKRFLVNIRLATQCEFDSILRDYMDKFGLDEEEIAQVAIYIREDFVSDGPGYCGPVAILHFAGGPASIDTMTQFGGRWHFTTDGDHRA